MSVKQYFRLAALGIGSLVATASAIAGGPDMRVVPPPSDRGFYVDLGLGYAKSNWEDFIGGVFKPTGIPFYPGAVTRNRTGGFTWGGDIGYRFNQYFGIEVGGYDLTSVRGNIGGGPLYVNVDNSGEAPVVTIDDPGPVKVTSWIVYVAGKASFPIFHNFDVFGKLGVAARFLNYSGCGLYFTPSNSIGPLNTIYSRQHYVTAIFGLGLQYWFNHHWSVAMQYLHVPGHTRNHQLAQQAPNVDLFIFNGGYLFST